MVLWSQFEARVGPNPKPVARTPGFGVRGSSLPMWANMTDPRRHRRFGIDIPSRPGKNRRPQRRRSALRWYFGLSLKRGSVAIRTP